MGETDYGLGAKRLGVELGTKRLEAKRLGVNWSWAKRFVTSDPNLLTYGEVLARMLKTCKFIKTVLIRMLVCAFVVRMQLRQIFSRHGPNQTLAIMEVIPVGHTLKCGLGVKRPSNRNPMYFLKVSIQCVFESMYSGR